MKRNRIRLTVTRKSLLFCMLTGCLMLAVVPHAHAQDTHYWNNQYGPQSMLLGGAVIGSVHDMSATFYNPGALGYIKEPELLLSANAYQTGSLKIKDGGGTDIDLETTSFSVLPNMLSGAFRLSWLGKNKFAYSLLTRHDFDAEVKGASVARADVVPRFPGDEEFAGSVRASGKANELWAGLSWARDVSPRVGVGITQYVSVRSNSGVSETFAQALSDSGDIALIFDLDNFSSSVYSLLWKAGIGLNFNPVTIGLTVTTPNVRLFGSGEASVNSTRVGILVDNDSIPDNTFETDVQNDVTANYKSPFSVGAGVGLFLERTSIHVSAEWFADVGAYDALELDGFTSQTTGLPVSRSLRDKRDSVFNVGVGVKQKLGEKYAGYASFNTDNSSFNPESDVAVTGYDIYHGTIGGQAAFGRTEWMLGLSYARGSEDIEQAINLNPDAGSVTSTETVEIIHTRMMFLVGFSVGL